MSALVSGLCERLSECVRDQRRTFRCEVIRDDSLNAVALPGGSIFISHSLVEFCERDAEQLAFVVGHEMAHIMREHAWNRMMKEAASGVLKRAASVVARRAGPLGGWFCQTGMRLLHSAYSQDDEQEADELGLRLVAAAGLSGAGAITLLQRIVQLSGQSPELGRYFATHPPAEERKARLEVLVRRLAR
jgi:predicted Zn-dependent protease